MSGWLYDMINDVDNQFLADIRETCHHHMGQELCALQGLQAKI